MSDATLDDLSASLTRLEMKVRDLLAEREADKKALRLAAEALENIRDVNCACRPSADQGLAAVKARLTDD